MDALPRQHLAALFLLATFAAWSLGPDVPLYWDSHGYVLQAITGRAGGLMLGRPTFVLLSHGVAHTWRLLGGELRTVEWVLRAFWTLVSAAGSPALAWLALELRASPRIARTAGFLLAVSPVVAHTSHAVLTDGPAMSASLLALALGTRASARRSPRGMLLAGLVLGLAAGLREPTVAAIVTLLGLAAITDRRLPLAIAALGGCATAIVPVVTWFITTQPGYLATVRQWSAEMSRERNAHPYGLRDFLAFLAWTLAAGPVLAISLATRWRALLSALRSARPAQIVIGVSGLQYLALAFYQDIAFSPRYLLAALPTALVLPAAWALDTARWRGVALRAAVLFAVLALPVLRWREAPLRLALVELPARLAAVHPRAAIVTGQVCPAVVFERTLRRLEGSPADFLHVCPGWRWPSDLAARLDALRAEGRPLVLDLRPAVWLGPRQRNALEAAKRYADRHHGDTGITVWR